MDYRELDAMIVNLRGQIYEEHPQKGHWKELWALVRDIGAGFRGVRFETKEDRDIAWKRFQELCDQAKEKGEANRQEMAARQKAWEQKRDQSERARSRIEVRAASAQPISDLERALGGIILLPLTLIERVIGKILGLRAKTQFEEVRDELRHCGEKLKEAWQTFEEHKRELLPGDKAQCFETLRRAQEKLNEAWTRLKEAQDQFYSEQRAAHEERQREWERKQADFRERVKENIEKLENNLEKARGALVRHEERLDKLESDHENAWSDGFREKCSGWIEEAREKIADIHASIEKMEGWLDEERGKLR